ncbi:GntR family transcriptional regulator [Mycolicibacterium sp. BK556]|uniref:GntR family transcriptional regulator n=1 Tax=Mycobacteriaceae TaxID=1762 RepID=UPI0010612FFA|nr:MULTISPECIES: GntR family transcriptional regulator [Mycobacteriaceae]MBB3602265.1 GntR family transcriptional regulator [Mycolicibacterium sp. BK556]MBB3632017.1 GntR family transcriptional regulator [Mycolicibacterium sp. BK607]MBB3750035.1 GntR family transcriptional regulator [Mycolicibacterium sp. BK634]TDO18692.1 GntR family transcriptional regulator [Mycobacterium sp. BK086]
MRVLSMDDAVLAVRPDLGGPSEQPAHSRIAVWLEKLIVTGRLTPGDKLPPEVEIAGALGVSRMTLRQALAAIEAKGLIRRSRGRFGGNFVETPRLEFDHIGLPGFTEQLRRLDMSAGARVIRAVTRQPTANVRHALQLKRGAPVHEIIRIRSANNTPVLLEETYLPAARFPRLLSADLTGSVYTLMDQFGTPVFSADEHIEATAASESSAELLGVAVGDPLLVVTRTAYDRNEVPVEFSHDYFRSDRTRIRVKSTVDRGPDAEVETSPAS